MIVAVVPAYNEEKNIGSVIKSLFGLVDKVVVVDDGSIDNTSLVALQTGAVVLRHQINRGQGAALQTGTEYAIKCGADYVLHFDADGQFDPLDIQPALKILQDANVNILFGSRFLGKKSNLPFIKHYILFPFGRIINRFFGGIWLTDVHNGFRILDREALNKIIITQDRMAHATEIITLTNKYKLKYVEFPVAVKYNEYGQSSIGGFKILKDLLLNKFIR